MEKSKKRTQEEDVIRPKKKSKNAEGQLADKKRTYKKKNEGKTSKIQFSAIKEQASNPKCDKKTSKIDFKYLNQSSSCLKDKKEVKDPDMKRKYSPLVTLVAKDNNISMELADNIIQYFEDEATIPFLVRYRGHQIGFKSAEELRSLKDSIKCIKQVQVRAEFIRKTLKSKNALTDDLDKLIENAHSLADLEELYEPFKTSTKSRIQQANDAGIVQPVRNFLEGAGTIIVYDIVDPNNKLIKDEDTVKKLITYIIGDLILKDIELKSKISQIYASENIFIISQKFENKKLNKNSGNNFSNYHDFRKHYKLIKPHQILAINRGEELKELKVCVDLPKSLIMHVENYIRGKWINRGPSNYSRKDILNTAISTEVIPKSNSHT